MVLVALAILVYKRRTAGGLQFELPDFANVYDRMQEAADLLIGTHDFCCFQTGHEARTTVRTIHRLEVRRQGPYVFVDVAATGHTVQAMTATAIAPSVVPARANRIADERPRPGAAAPSLSPFSEVDISHRRIARYPNR